MTLLKTFNTNSEKLIQTLFLFFLFLLPIFGKQTDFVESVIFYSLPPLFYFYLHKSRLDIKVPKKYVLMESILIILNLISAIFSTNPGVSYYKFFTLINIILIFNLSLILVKPTQFKKFLLIFTFIYSLIFLILKLNIVSPLDRPLLDNFIHPIWGHSYLSDFIVLSIPVLIYTTKNNLFPLLSILFVLGLTLSRSSLLSLFLLILLPKNTPKLKKYLPLFFAILSLLIINFKISQNQINYKSLLGTRPQYYAQATKAFFQKPLLGWGPGNFFVINSKFKNNSSGETSYAHNFFLNNLSENGIFFTIIFYLLILKAMIVNFRQNKLFFIISLVSLSNSMMDPSWHSYGILVISLYTIFYHSYLQQKTNQTKKTPINNLFAILVFVFFISKTSSDILYYLKKYQASLIVDPFNLNSRIALIKQSPNDQKNIDAALELYPNEKRLFTNLVSIPLPQSENYYYKLFSLNPQTSSHQHYLKLANFYSQNGHIDKLIEITQTLIDSNLRINIANLRQITTILYKQAINLFDQNSDLSIKLLNQATTLFPEEGHFQIDLANAYWHTDQIEKAFDQLHACLGYDSPKAQCQQYLDDRQNKQSFKTPGSPDFIDYIDNQYSKLLD